MGDGSGGRDAVRASPNVGALVLVGMATLAVAPCTRAVILHNERLDA